MSVQTQTAGRPILFGNAIAPVLERRDMQAAGRPILFGDAQNPASLQKRSIDIVVPEISTAGRPILFGDAKNPEALQKRGQEDSPFRIFPFNHGPTRKNGLVARQSSSSELDEVFNLNNLLALEQLIEGPSSSALTCEYKDGFSAETDPAVLCPYTNKLQAGCIGGIAPEDIKNMTPKELMKAGEKCAVEFCKEIEAGRLLKEMAKCFENVCEENKERTRLMEKLIAATEKSVCPLLTSPTDDTEVDEDEEKEDKSKDKNEDEDEDEDDATTTPSGTANNGSKASATPAAGNTKTGDHEEEEINSVFDDEESSAVRLGSGWKNSVLVGALVFGSLFSML